MVSMIRCSCGIDQDRRRRGRVGGVGVASLTTRFCSGKNSFADARVVGRPAEATDRDHARGREGLAGHLLVELREVGDRKLEAGVGRRIDGVDVSFKIEEARCRSRACSGGNDVFNDRIGDLVLLGRAGVGCGETGDDVGIAGSRSSRGTHPRTRNRRSQGNPGSWVPRPGHSG